MTRLALVSFGNEESYGLLYAGTELKKHGDIRYFDAEYNENLIHALVDYNPDYICFSPMSCFYRHSKEIERLVKEQLPNVELS